jgi:hypothetical protein
MALQIAPNVEVKAAAISLSCGGLIPSLGVAAAWRTAGRTYPSLGQIMSDPKTN